MFLFATCQKLKIFVFLAPILIKPQRNSLAVPFDNNKTLHFVNLCLIFSIILSTFTAVPLKEDDSYQWFSLFSHLRSVSSDYPPVLSAAS